MKIILLLVSCSFLLQCSSSSSPGPVSLSSCNSGERPMVVANKSSENIWLGVVAASQTCKTDADCAPGVCSGTPTQPPSGSNLTHYKPGAVCTCPANQCNGAATCGTTSVPQTCFLNLPRMINPTQPQKQAFLPSGSSLALCFPPVPSSQSTQWSGLLFARKGCDSNGQNCLSANCPINNSSGNCQPGRGGTPPATSAE